MSILVDFLSQNEDFILFELFVEPFWPNVSQIASITLLLAANSLSHFPQSPPFTAGVRRPPPHTGRQRPSSQYVVASISKFRIHEWGRTGDREVGMSLRQCYAAGDWRAGEARRAIAGLRYDGVTHDLGTPHSRDTRQGEDQWNEQGAVLTTSQGHLGALVALGAAVNRVAAEFRARRIAGARVCRCGRKPAVCTKRIGFVH